jgi:hypothetical protein
MCLMSEAALRKCHDIKSPYTVRCEVHLDVEHTVKIKKICFQFKSVHSLMCNQPKRLNSILSEIHS